MNIGKFASDIEPYIQMVMHNLSFELVQKSGHQHGTFAGMFANPRGSAVNIGHTVKFGTNFLYIPSSITLEVFSYDTIQPEVWNIWQDAFWVVVPNVPALDTEACAFHWTASAKIERVDEVQDLLQTERPPKQFSAPRVTIDCPKGHRIDASLDDVQPVDNSYQVAWLPQGTVVQRWICPECGRVSYVREHGEHEVLDRRAPEAVRAQARGWIDIARGRERLNAWRKAAEPPPKPA